MASLHSKYSSCSLLTLFLVLICLNLSNALIANKTIIMAKQILTSHNGERKAVGVPLLRWSSRLATYARLYASQRRKDCKLIHSPSEDFGENLFVGRGKRWTASNASAIWEAEKRWYHYSTNTCEEGRICTHYTQIVWRTTRAVGCAKVICNTGNTFFVCEYHPPGNYEGQRPY